MCESEVSIDVVVVSYNSAETLVECVAPLTNSPRIHVTIVDNASTDGTPDSVVDLNIEMLAFGTNHGFAYGCNRGWESGTAPFVLFLNPDARIEVESVQRLVEALNRNPGTGLVGPRILDADGALDFSQRRFPRLRSTYSQALFLHRVFPRASWSDEVIREPDTYGSGHTAEWLSGACMLVTREALQRIGGWNEAFFLYGEDQELCRRLWDSGYSVLYEPTAVAVHIGGVSRPRAELLPTLARSMILYANMHESRARARLMRYGIALGALTHAALTTKGSETRRGHLRAFRAACSSASHTSPRAG